MDNYIMLNGKKIKLTEEQVKILTEKKEEKKNVIHRVDRDECYHFIDEYFGIDTTTDTEEEVDCELFEKGNYYPIECYDLLIQDALHDELRNKLRKFTRNNGWNEDVWKYAYRCKWYLVYDKYEFMTDTTYLLKSNDIYFISEEIAERAIEEIVKPFKNAHPEFVW